LATHLAAAGAALHSPVDRLLNRLLGPSKPGWASHATGSAETMCEEDGNQKE
jgi:hypothetical protein